MIEPKKPQPDLNPYQKEMFDFFNEATDDELLDRALHWCGVVEDSLMKGELLRRLNPQPAGECGELLDDLINFPVLSDMDNNDPIIAEWHERIDALRTTIAALEADSKLLDGGMILLWGDLYTKQNLRAAITVAMKEVSDEGD